MKTRDPVRRCSECRRPFIPDPRVGDRQVTCGAPECQRRRHAGRCQKWHQRHPEAGRNHYRDVVVRLRRRHPSYQRRWRLGCRLREIREESKGLLERLSRRLSGVVSWGQSVRVAATGEAEQPRSIIAESLNEGLAAAAQLAEMLKEFRTLAMQAGALGV